MFSNFQREVSSVTSEIDIGKDINKNSENKKTNKT